MINLELFANVESMSEASFLSGPDTYNYALGHFVLQPF